MTIRVDFNTDRWIYVPETFPWNGYQTSEEWVDAVARHASEAFEYTAGEHTKLVRALGMLLQYPRMAEPMHRFVMTGAADKTFAMVQVTDTPTDPGLDDEALLGLPEPRATRAPDVVEFDGGIGGGRRSVRHVAEPALGGDTVVSVNWAWRADGRDVVVMFGSTNLVELDSLLPALDEFAASISIEADDDPTASPRYAAGSGEGLIRMSRDDRRDGQRMTRTFERGELIDRMFFVLALCICVELLIGGALNIAVQGLAGPITEDHALLVFWRALAWIPALLYVVLVVISLPVPRSTGRAPWTSPSGRMRLPVVGRAALLFFGFMTLWGTSWHAASFLPQNTPMPGSVTLLVHVVLGAMALLLLRIVLGWLRLVPRSWRVSPDVGGIPSP